MNKKTITRLFITLAVTVSIAGVSPISANAEWKQDQQTGWWWYEDGDYCYTGWKQIDGKWYYFYGNGYMADDTWVQGYKLGKDGAWIEQKSSEDMVTSNNNVSEDTVISSSNNEKYDFEAIGTVKNTNQQLTQQVPIADSGYTYADGYVYNDGKPYVYIGTSGYRYGGSYLYTNDGKCIYLKSKKTISKEEYESGWEEYRKRNCESNLKINPEDNKSKVIYTVIDPEFKGLS